MLTIEDRSIKISVPDPKIKRPKKDQANRLEQISKENPVVDMFLKLAVIPSSTVRLGHPKEAEMKQKMDEVRLVL